MMIQVLRVEKQTVWENQCVLNLLILHSFVITVSQELQKFRKKYCQKRKILFWN